MDCGEPQINSETWTSRAGVPGDRSGTSSRLSHMNHLDPQVWAWDSGTGELARRGGVRPNFDSWDCARFRGHSPQLPLCPESRHENI